MRRARSMENLILNVPLYESWFAIMAALALFLLVGMVAFDGKPVAAWLWVCVFIGNITRIDWWLICSKGKKDRLTDIVGGVGSLCVFAAIWFTIWG